MSKAIAYILNPEKTDEKLLVSSYGCASETAAREFCIFRPSESKETVGVSPPSREKQVQVHGRESTGVLFGKKWQRNASQSAPPRVIYSDWNPFLLRMESSPSMRIL